MDGTIHFARCMDCGGDWSDETHDVVDGWVQGHHKWTGHTQIDVWHTTPRRRVKFAEHRHAGWTCEDGYDDDDGPPVRQRAICHCGWKSDWHISETVGNRALGAHIAEATCQ